jgi:signal transduction histidine kinase
MRPVARQRQDDQQPDGPLAARIHRSDERVHAPISDEPGAVTLRRLLDLTSDGIALVRGERVAWANATLAAMHGALDAKDLFGVPLEDLFADAGHGIPDGPGHGPCRCRLLRPGQEPRAVVVEPIALGAPGEHALRVRDVTDLHTLESEVLRTGRQLHDANRELVALRERLRVETAEREEILTVVSHELRTPITVIAGFNRLLLGDSVGPLTERQRHFLEESQKGCQRLNAFVANLLEAARQGAYIGPLEVSETPICESIDAVLGLLAPLLREAGVEAQVTVADETPRARFDPPRIEQVLTNLVANAIRYAPSGTVVQIAVRGVEIEARPLVEVAVADAGPGVPERDRVRIFDPYVQVEERRAGGLGLGLAICKRIVEAHGGTIHADERRGGGARFVFRLPAATRAAEPA